MVKLLIISDDFTGALDTGVKFVACGVVTRVITDVQYNFADTDDAIQVLVIDAETRHLAPDEAYGIVRQIARNAIAAGINALYKKTDSALRGNIGSELQAMMDGTGKPILHFIPALPVMDRITLGGIHYINNIPVAESVFGQDPFEPVRASEVAAVIAEQTQVKVYSHRVGDKGYRSGIHVYDALSGQDLIAIGNNLREDGELILAAGCAGFAEVMPKLLDLEGNCRQDYAPYPGLVVLCGSLNPITEQQLEHAEKAGFIRFHLKPEEKLSETRVGSAEENQKAEQLYQSWKSNDCLILDSYDVVSGETEKYVRSHNINKEKLRNNIVTALGRLLRIMLDKGMTSTLLLTGGDTVLAFMKQIGVNELNLIKEISPGIILSRFIYRGQEHLIITKSGGFGSTALMADLILRIRNNGLR